MAKIFLLQIMCADCSSSLRNSLVCCHVYSESLWEWFYNDQSPARLWGKWQGLHPFTHDFPLGVSHQKLHFCCRGCPKSDLNLSVDIWEKSVSQSQKQKMTFLGGSLYTPSVYRMPPASHIALYFTEDYSNADLKRVSFNTIQLQYDLCCNCIFYFFFPPKVELCFKY